VFGRSFLDVESAMLSRMTENFWQELTRPFFVLAPMEDVTDTVFRQLVLEVSAPGCLHVVYAEFASSDGLCHPEGRDRVAGRLVVSAGERKLLQEKGVRLVAQVWGTDPRKFHRAAGLIDQEGGFDGIDINMGCPVRKIIRHGACAALIREPALAREIIVATKEATRLPVSVKTRTGDLRHETERWVGQLLEVEPAAIILHGRTRKMASRAPADWGEISRAVGLRDRLGSATMLVGNGDVDSLAAGRQRATASGVEGVMLGRGIFQNPWLFNEPPLEIGRSERLELLWRHVRLYTDVWGGRKPFHPLKRYFRIYAAGFAGAAELRSLLMRTRSPDEVRSLLDGWQASE
jgi:tRNA-dihydrouridine synthase